MIIPTITIDGYQAAGQCDLTGKSGVELVRVTSANQAIEGAHICFKALEDLIRFRAKLGERENADLGDDAIQPLLDDDRLSA